MLTAKSFEGNEKGARFLPTPRFCKLEKILFKKAAIIHCFASDFTSEEQDEERKEERKDPPPPLFLVQREAFSFRAPPPAALRPSTLAISLAPLKDGHEEAIRGVGRRVSPEHFRGVVRG